MTRHSALACTLTRVVGLGLLLLAALLSAVPAAQAAGAQHLSLPEEWDSVEHFDAGGGLCVDWPGSFHEVRHGTYDLTLPPGGQVVGEIHLNGAVDGYVELVPDDPALPTYTGSYREKITGVFVGVDEDGQDLLRVGHYALAVKLSGSDGSTVWLRLSGHVTLDASGRAVVARDNYSCR
jgi:hypothetical protein